MSIVNKTERNERAFYLCNGLLLLLFTALVIYPVTYIISASFSSKEALLRGEVWLFPVKPTLDGYRAVLSYGPVWTGYANSFFYMIFGTLISVFSTLLLAYPLSRRDCYGRNKIAFAVTFTMIFSGGMIPTYLLVQRLGLLNTRWALLLPLAITPYNVLISRSFFARTIPEELVEAGRLDGVNDIQFFIRIALPLSGAIIAVISLFYAVEKWNIYFPALLYLTKKELYPLQLILRDILTLNQVDTSMMSDMIEMERRDGITELLKYSLIVVGSLPVIVIYPFVQKFFVRGVMIGAVKG